MTERMVRRFLLVIVASLLSVGLIAVYSTTAVPSAEGYGYSTRLLLNHLAAITLGLLCSLGILGLSSATLRLIAKWAVVVSVALLMAVIAYGPEIGGAHRWFRIGRLSIQPSEFAQVALVLYVADVLARKRLVVREFREGVLPPLIVLGVMAGLVLLQPDLGTVVVMGAVVFVMLLVAKADGKQLSLVALLGMLALVVLIAGASYRQRRLLAFLDPWADPLGTGFQMVQSYLALGSGGLIGDGVGASLQKLFYLPGAHTDFIFAIVGEELGLLGTTAVLGLFVLFVLTGTRLALTAEDPFNKYLICGCVALISGEAVVNMAVVTGLMPTKGLPLPFVSYGGTSMVGNLAACALILRASHTRQFGMGNSECGMQS
ncbi:MAG: putative lipid II flippase FtsW [Candidatus Omnitrophica bacterium]|nr:putative lipid II flippase FtsW [Candidatus Omnitrophota bacterium]